MILTATVISIKTVNILLYAVGGGRKKEDRKTERKERKRERKNPKKYKEGKIFDSSLSETLYLYCLHNVEDIRIFLHNNGAHLKPSVLIWRNYLR